MSDHHDDQPTIKVLREHKAIGGLVTLLPHKQIASFQFLNARNESVLVTIPLEEVGKLYRDISAALEKDPQLFAPKSKQ